MILPLTSPKASSSIRRFTVPALLVAGSMLTLAGGIAALAILLVPVLLGSVTLMAMMIPLSSFVRSLKIISDMKTVPTAKLNQVLNAMKTVGNFFKKNGVSLKAIWNAAKYMLIMPPFTSAVRSLAKLKKLGVIPMKLVYGALNAIRSIANYYEENPITKKAIKAAYRYTDILWPFGYAIRQLFHLKKLGSLPMRLVNQTLDAIGSIAEFYLGVKVGFKDGIKAMIGSAMITGIVKSFSKAVGVMKDLKDLKNIPTTMRLGGELIFFPSLITRHPNAENIL